MRRACIDIGSNTTRLLVAECAGAQLLEVHQERSFTRIGRSIGADGRIAAAKLAEVTDVVSGQAAEARELGCDEIHAVATAAVRRAGNGRELADAVVRACGVEVRILSGEEEAKLAFLGASGTLEEPIAGRFGVVDVGGGSSELIAGTVAGGVEWCESFTVGSGDLADAMGLGERPSADALARARAHVIAVMAPRSGPPEVGCAVAVGGSATSMRQIVGPCLDPAAFARVFRLLGAEPTTEIARRFALDRERVRLLPAALLILETAASLFGVPLRIGRGGLREGVLLEAAGLA